MRCAALPCCAVLADDLHCAALRLVAHSGENTSADVALVVSLIVWSTDHWQGSKVYPYAQGPFPPNSQTLGDGMLHQLSQTTHYWWCWLAIGVTIGYVLLLNVLIVVFLTILPGNSTHSPLAAVTSLSAILCKQVIICKNGIGVY